MLWCLRRNSFIHSVIIAKKKMVFHGRGCTLNHIFYSVLYIEIYKLCTHKILCIETSYIKKDLSPNPNLA